MAKTTSGEKKKPDNRSKYAKEKKLGGKGKPKTPASGNGAAKKPKAPAAKKPKVPASGNGAAKKPKAPAAKKPKAPAAKKPKVPCDGGVQEPKKKKTDAEKAAAKVARTRERRIAAAAALEEAQATEKAARASQKKKKKASAQGKEDITLKVGAADDAIRACKEVIFDVVRPPNDHEVAWLGKEKGKGGALYYKDLPLVHEAFSDLREHLKEIKLIVRFIKARATRTTARELRAANEDS